MNGNIIHTGEIKSVRGGHKSQLTSQVENYLEPFSHSGHFAWTHQHSDCHFIMTVMIQTTPHVLPS